MLGHDHYIFRLRAACIAQPEWNRHQLAALDRELAMVRAATTPEQHLAASGDMIGLARASALDRAANTLATARRHDDPWAAHAAAIDYSHAQAGSNHVELFTSMSAGTERSSLFRARSQQIHSSFLTLFRSLLHIHTSNFELPEAHAAAANSFSTLRRLDAAFAPGKWRRQSRYAHRMPWDSRLIDSWLAPYWEHTVATPLTDPGLHPDPEEFAAGGWPDALPIETGADTTLADTYLRRQSVWPDEFLAGFWQTTRDAILAALSPIAQIGVSEERNALFAVESTRHFLEVEALLAPLTARANHGWEQSEASRAGIEKADATVHQLTGQSAPQILAMEATQRFLHHNIRPRLHHAADGFGALNGEPGFQLLKHAVPCHAVTGSLDLEF